VGFYEVNTLTLSNEEDQFRNIGTDVLPETEYVKLTNPISSEHTMLRMYLMPSLFNILRANKHRELPQRIFEVGTVIQADAKNQFKASALIIDSRANFTDIKSLAEALLNELYLSYEVQAKDVLPYIPGRCGVISVDGEEIGDFGEVGPGTISAFELGNPVIGLNLDVMKIMDLVHPEDEEMAKDKEPEGGD
jgi:phenylalanyl-tRNA synthetase beta chain